MISAYLEQLERDGYAPVTVAITKGWLEHLAEHAGNLHELTAANLTEYQQSLRWRPNTWGKLYSENTVNQAVNSIRRFYRWAHETGRMATDPAGHLTTRRVPPKPRRELTTDEARRLLAHPNPRTFHGCRDRAFLGLIIEHQLAYLVLARLDVSHFQSDTGALLVSGRRRGIVSLSDGLADDLTRYLNAFRPGVARPGELALFVSREGTRMTAVSFRQALDRHTLGAGLSNVRFSF